MKHLLLTTIAAVLFVGCSSFNHSVLVASFQMPTRGICAHRGVSDSHPENTIAAFREAIRLGAHMIELDVALSSDCLLYTSPSPRDATLSRMPSSA